MCCWVYFLFSPLPMFLLVLSSRGLALPALTSHRSWPACLVFRSLLHRLRLLRALLPPPPFIALYDLHISFCIWPRILKRLNVSVSMPADPACNIRHWQAHWWSTLRHKVNDVSFSTRCISLHLLDIRSKVSTLQKNTRTVQNGGRHVNNILVLQRWQRSEKRVKQEGKFSQGACWSPTFTLAYTVGFLACFWPSIWVTILTEESGQISISYSRERGPITCSQPAIKRLDELLTSCKKLWLPFL